MSTYNKMKTVIDARVKAFKKALKAEGLDGMIVTNVPDVSYLTGFTGDDSVLVIMGSKVILVTDSRFTVQVERQCPDLKFFDERAGMTLPQACAVAIHGKKGSKDFFKGKKIGIQSPYMSVTQLTAYKKAFGASVIKPVGHMLDKLRMVKDSIEISHIKKAVKIAGLAMAETIEWVKPGITEKQLCAYLEYRMMINGANGPGFPTIVAFGGHASECHAQPGMLKLKKNQPFLIDWGANVNGYTSDLTRCFCIGKLPSKVADDYQLLLEAQIAAIEAIAPGESLQAPEKAAREVLKHHPDCYSHGTGHGIGLDVHEQPFSSLKSKQIFEENMIVTVEPGIYPANKYGLRIEDDVLVTAKGRSVLSSSVPKTLDAVTI